MASSLATRSIRRWFQFRLRTLLIVMTLAAIVMGILSTKFAAARRQRIAVEKIRNMGGMASYPHEDPFAGLWLGPDPQPQGPAWVNSWFGIDLCNNVTYVDLDNAFAAISLSILRDLPYIESLDLNDLPATAERLQHVAAHEHLEKLTLDEVWPDGYATLARLKSLRVLFLSDKDLHDVTPLAQLQGLYALYLDNMRVGDLSPLTKLPNLKTLDLGNTRVADLSSLQQLSGLDQLDLTDVPSSAQEVLAIIEALPNCMVAHQFTAEDLAAAKVAARD